jgi:hypothetical protein
MVWPYYVSRMMRRSLVFLCFLSGLTGCPEVAEKAKAVGGAPAASLEQVRSEIGKAEAQAKEKLDAATAAADAQ